MFSLQTYEATRWLTFLFFWIFPFFNYPSLPNAAAQADYGMINQIVFLRFPSFAFYSREKMADKNFWSVLILVGQNYWSGENIGHY